MAAEDSKVRNDTDTTQLLRENFQLLNENSQLLQEKSQLLKENSQLLQEIINYKSILIELLKSHPELQDELE